MFTAEHAKLAEKINHKFTRIDTNYSDTDSHCEFWATKKQRHKENNQTLINYETGASKQRL
jgi:hypothetical protein